MSNITINISLQPDEESSVTMKKEIGTGERGSTFSSAPLPPESDEAITGTGAGDSISNAAGSGPAPPKEAYQDQELVTKHAASPPSFSDEDVTSVTSDTSGGPPRPPRDLPDDIAAEEGGNNNISTSPAPPESDNGNGGKKGESGNKGKK
ncbi:MAG: hypothetical protein U5K69_22175 [Balneolaceae bacterium]|nr:hypothetical protein [Balneolaceae bacterium]